MADLRSLWSPREFRLPQFEPAALEFESRSDLSEELLLEEAVVDAAAELKQALCDLRRSLG